MKNITNHFAPVYAYWQQFDYLTMHEIAAMMKGYDPRVLGDVVVNKEGDGVDLEFEKRILQEGIALGYLRKYGNEQRELINIRQLVFWLRKRGYQDMARGLKKSKEP